MGTVTFTWNQFSADAPDLARFGAQRLAAAPCYLATIRGDGTPRVHPVTPIVGPAGLHVFMEPTSPKGVDLRDRHWFALHNAVPDNNGTGGEFHLRGQGVPVDDPDIRAAVIRAATYEPAGRYLLFELRIAEVRSNSYGDIPPPNPDRWPATTRS